MELEDILEQTVEQRQKAERAAEDAILKLKIAGQWLPGEESGRSHDQTSSYRSLSEAFVIENMGSNMLQLKVNCAFSLHLCRHLHRKFH
jgi:hypothetical protein